MGVVSSKTARHTVRKWVFAAWIVASAAVALYIGLAGPFAHYFDGARPYIAYAVPALMFFFIASGLGWLALMALSKPPRRDDDHEK